MRTPYTYIPDDHMDLGVAGEHPIQFHAWIIHDGCPDTHPTVEIAGAFVAITHGYITQTLDVVHQIRKSPSDLRKWEQEILKSYLSAQEREWEAV
jgi:hypothetical protein